MIRPAHNKTGLTQSQLLMWIGQNLEPDNPLYNVAFTFKLKGEIDLSAFRKAFKVLVSQSDAMRLTFGQDESGTPFQELSDETETTLPFTDLSHDPDPEKSLDIFVKKAAQHKFDISKQLFDSRLFKLGPTHFVWYLNQHHLINDAWSKTVVYQQMTKLYQAALKDKINEVSTLPSFLDFQQEELQFRNSIEQQESKNYWSEKLTVLPETPILYGKANPDNQTNSVRIEVKLGEERCRNLRNLANHKDVRSWTIHSSLYNLFATAVFTFLSRVSNQDDLVIGTPAFNRTDINRRNTPGLFIEFYPLHISLKEEDTFKEVVNRVRDEANNFIRYAGPGLTNPALSSAFNVVFNYIHASLSDFGGIPMESKWIHPNHSDPGHHLRIQVHNFDGDDDLTVFFDMNTAVFDKELQKQTPQHFLNILDALIEQVDQSIFGFDILTKGEKDQLSSLFSPQLSLPQSEKNLVRLFEETVEKYPDHEAIRFQNQSITYSELNAQANQLAYHLLSGHSSAPERIAVYLKRSPELLISLLAVLKCGAAYIPIAASYPKERVRYMIENSEADFVISTDDTIDHLPENKAHVLWKQNGKMPWSDLQSSNLLRRTAPTAPAYIMYTSGSTGLPKGVVISHDALGHYLTWAAGYYLEVAQPQIPLFTSIAFDLTVTSLYLPLITGGTSVIYPEKSDGPDLAIIDVIRDNEADLIKLTPSHLALLQGSSYHNSRLTTMIVGGEDFKTGLADSIQSAFPEKLSIYNEYGPTEGTVGCIVHRFDPEKDKEGSVPIGLPVGHMQAFLLDSNLNMVPKGVAGDLYISGYSLANGYWQREDLDLTKFITVELKGTKTQRLYKTGDLASINEKGKMVFLGRKDEQVKIGGRRVELGEIETVLASHPDVLESAVVLKKQLGFADPDSIENCRQCGLPSNYPNISFDDDGVCSLCRGFESYQEKAVQYFKTPQALKALFDSVAGHQGEYDCLMLLSGGKDSTYALAQLVEMGLKVLTFTLDNGYISEQAKANVRRVTNALNVDHIFGETPAMNEIFVDSLKRHCNVCNGCFKTIYTLSTKIAYEKRIPFIVTGLSRGQFFETRLTEELFWSDNTDFIHIDEVILDARKAYHRVDDAVNRLLDTSVFEDDRIFEEVRFVDFYRYTDVSLSEMYQYLDEKLPWARPTDTGRSTNCIINKVGIYVHKNQKGYSNYAFPYSWDVRIGHKTREASLDEINEAIDEQEVNEIMQEIGFSMKDLPERPESVLVAYYVAEKEISPSEFRRFLSRQVPDFMIPLHFIRLDALPLTANGKVDRKALPDPGDARPNLETPYQAPENEIEGMLAELWTEILELSRVGILDNFLDLGGTSLAAIRLIARINTSFDLDLPVGHVFEYPTVKKFAKHIEQTIIALLNEQEDS